VLKNFDLLQAESLDLLSEEADILEMAENMEWIDSMTDAELVVLAGNGG
jgi:fructose-specific component phosphotransferase system IIB-like protein